jgi:hypothetical protein
MSAGEHHEAAVKDEREISVPSGGIPRVQLHNMQEQAPSGPAPPQIPTTRIITVLTQMNAQLTAQSNQLTTQSNQLTTQSNQLTAQLTTQSTALTQMNDRLTRMEQREHVCCPIL